MGERPIPSLQEPHVVGDDLRVGPEKLLAHVYGGFVQRARVLGVGDRSAALPAGVCRAGGRVGVHGVGAVRVCLPPLALPPTPRHARGWSSYPPRGPFGVDRHALVPDPHSGVRRSTTAFTMGP